MQLTPRYLVSNRTFIISDDAGQITEFDPVYKRQLVVYRGIDNVLEFQLLNSDQKPIDLNQFTLQDSNDTATVFFTAFDENQRQIIQREGEIVSGDDSAVNRGLFTVTITGNDLLNVKSQYLSYTVILQDSHGRQRITYTDTGFGQKGTILVSTDAFPGPAKTYSVTNFLPYDSDEQNDEWYSEWITAEPALNGNAALHTVAIYSDGYAGDIIVQGTLENIVDDNAEAVSWVDIDTVSFDGSSESEPVPVNFNGVFSFLRFKATANPVDITKILVRS